MKKICYFGIYDPKHWRTRIIIRAFTNAGYEVVECRVDPREIKGLRKYIELYKRYKALKTKFDYVIVGFPGYLPVLLARMITSSPIIFDAYISYFDGIRDRRDYSPAHPMMWVAWLIDFLSGKSADIVLTINYAYKDFFVKTLKMRASKVEVLHKGADEELFYERPYKEKPNGRLIIGWWGSFIPLHGLPIIIEAARILREEKDIEFHIVGGGQLASEIKEKIRDYGLDNIKMFPYMPQAELVEKISGFGIALGIFAATPKAGRCVTNKVYEAMAMGKPIITEDSRANREIFTHKVNVYLVSPGDPTVLAEAIKEMRSNAYLRHTIGKNAGKLFKEHFASDKIEQELLAIIKCHA